MVGWWIGRLPMRGVRGEQVSLEKRARERRAVRAHARRAIVAASIQVAGDVGGAPPVQDPLPDTGSAFVQAEVFTGPQAEDYGAAVERGPANVVRHAQARSGGESRSRSAHHAGGHVRHHGRRLRVSSTIRVGGPTSRRCARRRSSTA